MIVATSWSNTRPWRPGDLAPALRPSSPAPLQPHKSPPSTLVSSSCTQMAPCRPLATPALKPASVETLMHKAGKQKIVSPSPPLFSPGRNRTLFPFQLTGHGAKKTGWRPGPGTRSPRRGLVPRRRQPRHCWRNSCRGADEHQRQRLCLGLYAIDGGYSVRGSACSSSRTCL